MAETDVVTSKLEDRILGVRILATAVLGAAIATDHETALAVAVLEASTRNMTTDAEPREVESIASSFNRHMDAVLDAANASHAADSRVTRRAHMAKAIDRAGLLLVERGYVAAMFDALNRTREQAQAIRKYPLHNVMPDNVRTATAYLDDVLAAQHPEIFKEWLIVCEWIGKPVEGVASDSEAR